MPDWSYRTLLRPILLSLGPERARRLATTTLATLTRLPLGLAGIDFLGHMRADTRLRLHAGGVDFAGPVALGSLIDPAGQAAGAFARFGTGLIEVGPVAAKANGVTPAWRVDIENRSVSCPEEQVVAVDDVAASLGRIKSAVPFCIRIAGDDPVEARRIAERLAPHAALFSVEMNAVAAAINDLRPVLLRVSATSATPVDPAGLAGVWIYGRAADGVARVKALRASLPRDAIIIASGVTAPDDLRRLRDAGADVGCVDEGLIVSGPGLVKRCNEALLSSAPAEEPEPLSLDAARRAWFWALLLGAAMFAGGVLAIGIASTRIVLPYDESMAGMSRAQINALNPRVLAFMSHDRVSLAGAMLSIGILYSALAWFGVRRGAHWAHVTVLTSAIVGFFSFFFFLGFGYFDPFHAFVTAVLTQFTLLCMTMHPSPPQPPPAEWTETAAWRRGQWGQLLFILMGAGITGAGCVISFIGCTSVFVETDLEFMRTTAAQLHASYERLVPLVAHDRASLGGMLLANGVAIWLSAQWGFRKGAKWLWVAFALAGNIAFASAIVVHFIVGYHSPLHLAPAFAGWGVWNLALLLTHGWLAAPQKERTPAILGDFESVTAQHR